MKNCLLVILGLFANSCVFADSPLTSTFFAPTYKDVPAIQRILELLDTHRESEVKLDGPCLAFLDATSHTWDQNIALINALGWGQPSNTAIYIEHLSRKYGINRAIVDSLLTGSIASLDETDSGASHLVGCVISDADLLSLAYMQVMGEYFMPLTAIEVIEYVYMRNRSSQAVALVGCLIAGQFLMELDWCAVYHCTDILFLEYDKDLIRKEALQVVQGYMDLYAGECDEFDVAVDSTMLEEVQQPSSYSDPRVTSLDAYKLNPVYTKPAQKQLRSKREYVDLVLMNKVKKNEMALNHWLLYNEEVEGTEIQLEIKNTGTITSVETNVLIRILRDEAQQDSEESYLQQSIPAIPAGATHRMSVIISGYWIYDPNAHFTIELDFDNNIEEKDETNNRLTVFEWG